MKLFRLILIALCSFAAGLCLANGSYGLMTLDLMCTVLNIIVAYLDGRER